MESIIYRAFETVFKVVGILLMTGFMTSALTDIQKRAFHSKQAGLTSMLKVNQQLVGKSQ